jgi:hypothetical protein
MKKITTLLLLLLVSPLSLAQVYLGAGYSQSDARVDTDSGWPELEGDSGMRVFLGNNLSDKFAVEMGYVDFGSYQVGTLSGEPDPLEVQDTLAITAFELALVGRFAMTRKVGLFTRLGAFWWEAERVQLAFADGEASAPEETRVSYDDFDVFLGMGLDYRFSSYAGLRVDASAYRTYEAIQAAYGVAIYFTF